MEAMYRRRDVTEEEQGSVFGGLAEAAGAAWDAAGNVASAGYDAGSAVVSEAEAVGDVAAATGNEIIGDIRKLIQRHRVQPGQ